MEYLKLANMEKLVSKMVFGTAMPTISGAAPGILFNDGIVTEEKKMAFDLLDQMFELGVTTFDCAAAYGEEVIGAWTALRGIRDKVVIITKCALPNYWRQRMTEFDILADLHDSLKKLRTDYIDIYMFHRDDPSVPVSMGVELLNKLYREGKIGEFGASNWTQERIAMANEYANKNGLKPFTVSEPNFGIAEQVADPWGGGCVSISGPENKKNRQWFSENEITVFAYSSLGRGFFSGMFKSNEKEKAKEVLDSVAIKGYYSENNFKRLARIEQLAKKLEISVAQLSLAWIFNQPLKVAALSSPVNVNQMKENINASKIRLTENELKWLDLEIDEI